MPISFTPAGTFSGVAGATLQNPTSLQFGPDGRLYVSEQNGSINAYTVSHPERRVYCNGGRRTDAARRRRDREVHPEPQ